MNDKDGGTQQIKTVSVMMLITLAGKALGLLRDSWIGSHYGTDSIEGTAFFIARILPNTFFDTIFASAISASFIPIFSGVLLKEGRDSAFKLSHKFISLIFTLSVGITLLLMVFTAPVVSIYDAGKNPAAIPLAIQLTRIMFPIIILSGLAFSLTGILQSLGEFNIPAAMGFASNSVILIYYRFFMDRFGVVGLTVAFLLGWAAQFFIQIPFLIKNKFSFKFSLPKPRELIRDPDFRQIGMLALPVLVGTWVAPINHLINTTAAMRDVTGQQAFNAVTYANGLYTVLTGVFVLSVSNFIFPRLSRLNASNDGESFSNTLKQTLRVLFYFLIPMSVGLMCLSRPIIKLYLERGSFTELSTQLTSTALFYFAIGMPGYGVQTILAQGFYASKNGKVPLITGIIAMLCNFVLSFSLVKLMGSGGPALASAISITLTAGIMLIIMNKKYNGIVDRELFLGILKMLISGFVMAIAVIMARDYIASAFGDGLIGRILCLLLPTLIGAGIYLALTVKDLRKCIKF